MSSIAVGSDQLGFELKSELARHLAERGYEVADYGTTSAEESEDYPDVAERVALAVAGGKHDRAVLICGTGIGMAIAANKVPGVRAAQASDTYSAERARASNNAQVITMGALTVAREVAKDIVDHWLDSEFQGGRSAPKVAKIEQIERSHRERAQTG
ncbi:ribose 5-phosphate isomerase B [Prauserella muralis]|uniref:Ribose 5-phosphate isomerase B n=1 Tax=Prauserella muralis TaxID=588067 RepID=A0A2V4AYL7_9PSEU|nr:ribose 5-phosphate isomerase B [Prauserella muralis]PXY26982.1 ribose 5-phosphate isomerase B [Prauserella muralis]TWE23401.1 ribose 5-phosphate isomerase B [Prauserella muralis]